MHSVQSASPAWRGYAVLAVSQSMLGMAGIFASFALMGAGAIEITLLRLLIAAPVVVIAAKLRGLLIRVDRADFTALAAAGVALGLHFVLWIESLRFIPVAVATLLVCSTPFWLAAYDALILRKRVARRGLMAMLVAFAALVVVIFSSPSTPGMASNAALAGAVMAGVAAILVGVYLALLRRVQRKFRTLTVVSYTYPCALLAVLPLELIAREPLPANTVSWTGVLLISFCTHIIGHTALSASLRYFSPTTVAFVNLLEPVIAAGAAAILLGQRIGIITIAGASVLLIAIAGVLATQQSAESLALDVAQETGV